MKCNSVDEDPREQAYTAKTISQDGEQGVTSAFKMVFLDKQYLLEEGLNGCGGQTQLLASGCRWNA